MVFLKEILGDELYEQVAAKLEGTDIKLANVADGSFIDKATYDADIQKAKEEAAASIDTSELEGIKAENDSLKNELEKLKFESEIGAKIAARHPKNAKAVRALLDDSKITMGENGFQGIDEQLDEMEVSDSYLFGEALPGGLSHGSATKGLTKEEFDKMSYQDKLKVYNETPELYNELTK